MSCAHFCSSLVSRGQLRIISVTSRCRQETPDIYEVKLGNCGDIGTGTKSSGTGTHIQMRCSGVLVPIPSQSGTGTHIQMRCSGVLVLVPH